MSLHYFDEKDVESSIINIFDMNEIEYTKEVLSELVTLAEDIHSTAFKTGKELGIDEMISIRDEAYDF